MSSGGNHSSCSQHSCMQGSCLQGNMLPSPLSMARSTNPLRTHPSSTPNTSGPLKLAHINRSLQILSRCPESSIGPPASRPMTRITDPDSEMESGVAPSMPPASSALPLLAAAQDTHASLAQMSVTSSSMSLTFIRPSTPIACIDNLPYMGLYAQTLPYG